MDKLKKEPVIKHSQLRKDLLKIKNSEKENHLNCMNSLGNLTKEDFIIFEKTRNKSLTKKEFDVWGKNTTAKNKDRYEFYQFISNKVLVFDEDGKMMDIDNLDED